MASTENTPPTPTTAAFQVQAALSFGIGLVVLVVGVAYLPVDGWIRAFLGLGVLYVVTSAFTLAKTIRDRQDEGRIVTRVDQARLDHYLVQHDPFRTPAG